MLARRSPSWSFCRYAIVVAPGGPSTSVTEHKLANHASGSQLDPSVRLVSAIVVGSRCTVVLTRPFSGKNADYYTFDVAADGTMPYLYAVGSSATFG